MTAALRALMSGVIDYAGLFPPAKLWLGEAVREYVEIRESIDDTWMLGRFVISASQLPELERWGNMLCQGDLTAQLTVTGRPAEDFPAWQENLRSDVQTISKFRVHWGERIRVEALELPLSVNLSADDGPDLLAFLSSCVGLVPPELGIKTVFLEVPEAPHASETRRSVIQQLGHRIRSTEKIGFSTRLSIGFKFRTGGLTAEAFPSDAQLADVIHECATHNCLWKATAGLHHALRHDDPGIGVTMHGFLNVLFANAFARSHMLSRDEIQEIIANRYPRRFQMDDFGIRWNDRSLPTHSIPRTRFSGFQSFGSCSFAEPRDDLKALGLL